MAEKRSGNPKDAVAKADEYVVHTSEEVTATARSLADGASGRNFTTIEQNSVRVHRIPGSRHEVKVALLPEELERGVGVDALAKMTGANDADTAFMLYYLCSLLISTGVGTAETVNPTVSIDDVISKIGWDPRSAAERQELRSRVWEFIKFGSRVQVTGERKGKYKDPMTGETLSTAIDAVPWSILDRERLEQPSLFPDGDIPLRVQIAAGREWWRLISDPRTSQFLPMGQELGVIPPSKPSGAWARVMGLSLMHFWRREPAAAMDGSIRPHRQELLEQFPPKTGPVWDLLSGPNPRYAMQYWCGGLEHLVQIGFVDAESASMESYEAMRKRFPRTGWQQNWMKERVFLKPGPKIREEVIKRSSALPARSTKRGPGRPRKNPG